MITTGDRFSYHSRVTTSFIILGLVIALLPYLVYFTPRGYNFWVLFLVFIPFGAFQGIAQGTVYTMAAGLPFKYMGAVQFGSGVCGLVCNGIRAVTIAMFPS